MNAARIVALASRIIRQVLRDRRTLALIFIAPLLVMTLLYLVLTNTSSVHTLALVRPGGQGSDRINTLIDNLLPGKERPGSIPYGHENSPSSSVRRMKLSMVSTARFEATSPAECPPIPSATTNSFSVGSLMKLSSLDLRTGPRSLRPWASITCAPSMEADLQRAP